MARIIQGLMDSCLFNQSCLRLMYMYILEISFLLIFTANKLIQSLILYEAYVVNYALLFLKMLEISSGCFSTLPFFKGRKNRSSIFVGKSSISLELWITIARTLLDFEGRNTSLKNDIRSFRGGVVFKNSI